MREQEKIFYKYSGPKADKEKTSEAEYLGEEYVAESGEGDYYISERPWSPKCFGINSHAIKIRVEHATKYSMASMGKRYCFAFGNFIKVEYEKYKGMSLKSNYLSLKSLPLTVLGAIFILRKGVFRLF